MKSEEGWRVRKWKGRRRGGEGSGGVCVGLLQCKNSLASFTVSNIGQSGKGETRPGRSGREHPSV